MEGRLGRNDGLLVGVVEGRQVGFTVGRLGENDGLSVGFIEGR